MLSSWSAEEAAAFLWFETAEELALALASPREREKSAALFAFGAIQHLKSDLRHYLGGVDRLMEERENITMCIDLPNLDAHLSKVMHTLGVPDFEMPTKPKTHATPTPLPKLSTQAEAALRDHWVEEFEIYDAACNIARQLGFSG